MHTGIPRNGNSLSLWRIVCYTYVDMTIWSRMNLP